MLCLLLLLSQSASLPVPETVRSSCAEYTLSSTDSRPVDCCSMVNNRCVIPALGDVGYDPDDTSVSDFTLARVHGFRQFAFGADGVIDKRQAGNDGAVDIESLVPVAAVTVDHRRHLPGLVNQGNCGSCVLFSYTNAVTAWTNMLRTVAREEAGVPLTDEPVRLDYQRNVDCYESDIFSPIVAYQVSFEVTLRIPEGHAGIDRLGIRQALRPFWEARAPSVGAVLTDRMYAALGKTGYTWQARLSASRDRSASPVPELWTLWQKDNPDVKQGDVPVPIGGGVEVLSLTAEAATVCNGVAVDDVFTWALEQQMIGLAHAAGTNAAVGNIPVAETTVPPPRGFGRPDVARCTAEAVTAGRDGPLDGTVSVFSNGDDKLYDPATKLTKALREPWRRVAVQPVATDPRADPEAMKVVRASSFNMLYALLRYGPAMVTVNACRSLLQAREHDLLREFGCTSSTHKVTLIGVNYDPDRADFTDNYWIIANSWGERWGNGGIGHIAFGAYGLHQVEIPQQALPLSGSSTALGDERWDASAKAMLHRGMYPEEKLVAYFEAERGVLPLPQLPQYGDTVWAGAPGGEGEPRIVPTVVRDEAQLGAGAWHALPLGQPVYRLLTGLSDRPPLATLAHLPRVTAETVSIVLVVPASVSGARDATVTLRAAVWPATETGRRPAVYPLGVQTLRIRDFVLDTSPSARQTGRLLGAFRFVMRPLTDNLLSDTVVLADDEHLILPADEWGALELAITVNGASFPVYWYGGSIRVLEEAAPRTRTLARGTPVPRSTLLAFDPAAYDVLPNGWEVGSSFRTTGTVDGEGGMSPLAIGIVVGATLCACASVALVGCVVLLLVRRRQSANATVRTGGTRVAAPTRPRSYSRRRSSAYMR